MGNRGLKLLGSKRRRRMEETGAANPGARGDGRRGQPDPGERADDALDEEQQRAEEDRRRREEQEEQKKVALLDAQRFQARQVKLLEDEARPLLAGLLANPGIDPSKWDPTDLAHLSIQLAVALRAAAEETVASIPPAPQSLPEDEILF